MTRPVALVSGGTAGLGLEVALTLARRGWEIVAFGAALPEERCRDDADLPIEFLVADTAIEAKVERAIRAAAARTGRIDALVVNAAVGPLGTVLDTDPQLWDRIMAVNLRGPYLCARGVIPHMRAKGGGAIVFVGSGAGWGKPDMAAYATSKGGLATLAQCLAYDFFHDHIRVNTVIPGGGGIVSGMSLARVGGDLARLARGGPGTVAGRPADGHDLAAAIAFLLSPEAAAISGTVLDVGCFSHQGGPVPPLPLPEDDAR